MRGLDGGYVAFVEEFPGANTQGATLDEARAKASMALRAICPQSPAQREIAERVNPRAAS
jgi:predicted RNase H-like HicB family nuclease